MFRLMKTTKMRFKNTFFFLIYFMLPVTVSAGISGNITLTSDYIWRGVSQTTGDPALQGGVAYSHENGFYAGVWGSNVDSMTKAPPARTQPLIIAPIMNWICTQVLPATYRNQLSGI
jgi:hypothetical protein